MKSTIVSVLFWSMIARACGKSIIAKNNGKPKPYQVPGKEVYERVSRQLSADGSILAADIKQTKTEYNNNVAELQKNTNSSIEYKSDSKESEDKKYIACGCPSLTTVVFGSFCLCQP